MTDVRDTPRREGEGREEELRERYRELLEELRTILPGVQVLFAFLLTAPFSARFGQLDELGRDLYTASLLGTTLAMVLLLTPASYHRIAPRQQRDQRVKTGVALMLSGMITLAMSVLLAVFTVVRFVFDAAAAAGVIAPGALLLITLWFAVPWLRRNRFERGYADRDDL